jgi:hypothetical protein
MSFVGSGFLPFVLMLLHLWRLVGACGRRPLWSPPWVPVTFGHCFLFFISFYSLFFTALPLPCPCPCLALFRIFLLVPRTGRGSYTGNGQCFFFLLLLGTGGGSYKGNGYLKQDRTYTWWEAFEHMQKLLSRK